MALPNSPSLLFSVGIAALIAWRVYSRVRRTVGRQRLSQLRPWITVTLFPTLVAVLLFALLAHPYAAWALVAGVTVGAMLGALGLRLTRFERTPLGLFYTPNPYLGVAVSLLFLGRIAYRFVRIYVLDAGADAAPSDFLRNPLTLLIFGTLAGYYVMYAVGLLRWRRRTGRSDAQHATGHPET